MFAAGTNQWSWGLGPHWIDQPGSGQSYQDPPTDSTDARISQATYNMLSDMNVQPITPVGLTLDSGNQPPSASFTVSPNPAQTGQTVTFDASGSTDTDGTIAKYEWDLDGNGTYDKTTPTPRRPRRPTATAGPVTAGLRVTDNGGASADRRPGLTVSSGDSAPYAQASSPAALSDYWRLGRPPARRSLDRPGRQPRTPPRATARRSARRAP